MASPTQGDEFEQLKVCSSMNLNKLQEIAWRPAMLQSMDSQRVGHDFSD